MNVKNQSYINCKQEENMNNTQYRDFIMKQHESLKEYVPNPHLFWSYFVIYERDTMELLHLFSNIKDYKTKQSVEHVACVMKYETNKLKTLLSASRAEIVEIRDRIDTLYQHVS